MALGGDACVLWKGWDGPPEGGEGTIYSTLCLSSRAQETATRLGFCQPLERPGDHKKPPSSNTNSVNSPMARHSRRRGHCLHTQPYATKRWELYSALPNGTPGHCSSDVHGYPLLEKVVYIPVNLKNMRFVFYRIPQGFSSAVLNCVSPRRRLWVYFKSQVLAWVVWFSS